LPKQHSLTSSIGVGPPDEPDEPYQGYIFLWILKIGGGKGIVNDKGNVMFFGNARPHFNFQDQIKGFVVESTDNWYRLVDGLMDEGYSSAHLADSYRMGASPAI
jgi:hypothetical protein